MVWREPENAHLTCTGIEFALMTANEGMYQFEVILTNRFNLLFYFLLGVTSALDTLGSQVGAGSKASTPAGCGSAQVQRALP